MSNIQTVPIPLIIYIEKAFSQVLWKIQIAVDNTSNDIGWLNYNEIFDKYQMVLKETGQCQDFYYYPFCSSLSPAHYQQPQSIYLDISHHIII